MKRVSLILVFICAIALLGCKKSDTNRSVDEKSKVNKQEISESIVNRDNIKKEVNEDTINEDNNTLTYKDNSSNEVLDSSENIDIEEDGYNVSDNIFNNQNIKITYPVISNCENKDIEQMINDKIYAKVLSISNYYDINSNPIMDINYSIKTNDNNIMSIVFQGYGNCDNAAYPIDLFYTINIDLYTGMILRLTDMVNIDEEFINKLKSTATINNIEIENYFNTLTDEEIIDKLNNSDNEYSEISSYLTSNGYIGISIQVPHAIGDHLEYEIIK